MTAFVKILLDWLSGKLINWGTKLFKKLIKKKEISDKVDKEEDEIDKIMQEIEDYLEANPEVNILPSKFEDRLRAATDRRNDGLRG